MTNPTAPTTSRTDDEQFTVRIPGAPGADSSGARPTTEPLTSPVSGDGAAERDERVAEVAAVPASRRGRFGAALFWMALGWWFVIAVRFGVELFDATWAGDGFRTISGSALADVLREVTARGKVELLAVAGLSLLATLVLLSSRARRLLGVLSLLVTAGTIGLAVWHLTT